MAAFLVVSIWRSAVASFLASGLAFRPQPVGSVEIALHFPTTRGEDRFYAGKGNARQQHIQGHERDHEPYDL
jgi:hypothetical protein